MEDWCCERNGVGCSCGWDERPEDEEERRNGCSICGKIGCCADDHSSRHLTGRANIALG